MNRYQVIFFLLIITPFLTSCGNSEERPQQKGGKMQVEAFYVEGRNLENTISTTGSIMANEEVQLQSEVAGRVQNINFKEGDPVKKGQLLVAIDNEQYHARLQRVKVQLEQARKNRDRQKELLDIEGVSQEVYEEAELRVADLKAQQAELQAQLDNTIIRAPFDGTIGLRMISPGSYINPGDNIAYLVQDNPVKIEFSIPEGYAGQIKQNSSIQFTVTAIKDTLKAMVYAIEPRIDPESRSIAVRARADNNEGKLVPGAFSEVQVNLDTYPDAILIPTSAVITENNGKSVFVIKNGKAVKKSITTGIRTSDNIHVLEGLQEKDTLVTTGLLGLKEGTELGVSKLINPTRKTAQQ